MDFPTEATPSDLNTGGSARSVGEIMLAFQENSDRHRTLRRRSQALVASRLAKQIGPDEYAAHRKEDKDDMLEVQQRRMILLNELAGREHPRG